MLLAITLCRMPGREIIAGGAVSLASRDQKYRETHRKERGEDQPRDGIFRSASSGGRGCRGSRSFRGVVVSLEALLVA